MLGAPWHVEKPARFRLLARWHPEPPVTDVVVVGAGPVGALLAAELAAPRRRGARARAPRPPAGTARRAIGVHAPVLAALERSGVTERLLEKALRVPRGEARSGDHVLGVVRFDRLSTRFPFVATLPQAETEAVLAAVAPAPERGPRSPRVRPRAGEVELERDRHAGPDDGAVEQLTAPIVVLAGGWTARSLVYRDGRVPHDDLSRPLPHVGHRGARPADADTAVVNLAPSGVLESFPLPGSLRRFVAWDAADRCSTRSTWPRSGCSDCRPPCGLGARHPSPTRSRPPRPSASVASCAPQLRRGRLFVIGDAAHEVSPIGGQGMNLGLLDAIGLAPLLARVGA